MRGEEGPGLKDFIAASAVDSLQECEASAAEEEVPYLQKRDTSALGRKGLLVLSISSNGAITSFLHPLRIRTYTYISPGVDVLHGG